MVWVVVLIEYGLFVELFECIRMGIPLFVRGSRDEA